MDQPPFKFQRVELGKKRPYYLVWPPDGRLPIELHSRKRAQEFLEKERLSGVVSLESFNFKSSTPGEGKDTNTSGSTRKTGSKVLLSAVFDEVGDVGLDEDVEETGRGKFNLQNMLRSSTDIDHKKVLTDTAKLLETIRFENGLPDLESAQFESLQSEVRKQPDVEAMVGILGTCDKAVQAMAQVVERRCLEELMTLGAVEGPHPLSEWPIVTGALIQNMGFGT